MSEDSRSRSLDLEVALRADDHAWVRWKDHALRGAGQNESGRFVAPRHTPVAHLQEPAGEDVPLARAPFRHLKPYSSDTGLAIALAERVGLFGAGGARLSRSSNGSWILTANRDLSMEGPAAAPLVCKAILRHVAVQTTESDV